VSSVFFFPLNAQNSRKTLNIEVVSLFSMGKSEIILSSYSVKSLMVMIPNRCENPQIRNDSKRCSENAFSVKCAYINGMGEYPFVFHI
jgi:hypothetical protein